MNQDWKNEIINMIYVKQELLKLDTDKIWHHHLPEIAATEKQIIDVENALGYSLDVDYRSFLKFANGWKALYQTVDLFGTIELVSSKIMNYAKAMLEAIEDDVIDSSGFSKKELLPIAATMLDKDLFVISNSESHKPGLVIWFAGEEIDRFPSFKEYFLAMIDYNRLMVNRLKDKKA